MVISGIDILAVFLLAVVFTAFAILLRFVLVRVLAVGVAARLAAAAIVLTFVFKFIFPLLLRLELRFMLSIPFPILVALIFCCNYSWIHTGVGSSLKPGK